jgi:cytochrome c oxidase subunit 3
MEVKTGTIEPLSEDTEESAGRPRPVSRGGGNGNGRKGKRGDGGGGDDGGGSGGGGGPEYPQPSSPQETAANSSVQKYRISMAAVLVVAFMTFVGLSMAYVMLAAFDLPFQLWISTGLILISSLTFEFGKNNLRSGGQMMARNWFCITTVLGAMFIASQVMAWLELVARGVYMSGNPYAGFFYILTAVHAAHVFGGMGALGYVVLKIWNQTKSKDELQRRYSAAKISGWFWHFLGILWVGLFLLLGFWK